MVHCGLPVFRGKEEEAGELKVTFRGGGESGSFMKRHVKDGFGLEEMGWEDSEVEGLIRTKA